MEDINLCTKDGVSPIYIACENRHSRTMQLLMNNWGYLMYAKATAPVLSI